MFSVYMCIINVLPVLRSVGIRERATLCTTTVGTTLLL